MFIIIFYLFIFIVFNESKTNFQKEIREKIEEGLKSLEYIQELAKGPGFGGCWINALEELKVHCEDMNEESQLELTLLLTNCFLQATGRSPHICSLESSSLKKCLSTHPHLDIFSTFFTHTQNVCFYLEQHLWQQKTHKNMAKLSDMTSSVASTLEDSKQVQQNILSQQLHSYELQQQLVQEGELLKNILENSKIGLNELVKDFKDNSANQGFVLFEVFERIKTLQNFLVNEMSGLLSFVFFIGSTFSIYILTTAHQIKAARLPLLIVMTTNFFVERLIYSHMYIFIHNHFNNSSSYYSYIQVSRKMSLVICIFIVIWSYFKFEDLGQASLKMLNEIKKQNLEIKRYIQNSNELKRKKIKRKFEENTKNSTLDALYWSSTVNSSSDFTFRIEDEEYEEDSIEMLELHEDIGFLQSSTPFDQTTYDLDGYNLRSKIKKISDEKI